MGVSWNCGTPKTPQNDHFEWENQWLLGTTILGTPHILLEKYRMRNIYTAAWLQEQEEKNCQSAYIRAGRRPHKCWIWPTSQNIIYIYICVSFIGDSSQDDSTQNGETLFSRWSSTRSFDSDVADLDFHIV